MDHYDRPDLNSEITNASLPLPVEVTYGYVPEENCAHFPFFLNIIFFYLFFLFSFFSFSFFKKKKKKKRPLSSMSLASLSFPF